MGHFYTQDGKPCHYQPDGSDTTLRHARKQNLVPSVTTITDIIKNEGLQHWLINATPEELEQSREAMEAGSSVHNALEKAYLGKEVPDEHLSTVDAVTHAIYGVYGSENWNPKPEVTFSTVDYGGTVDLVCPNAIIDYKRKSKPFDLKKDGTPKKIWYMESHCTQLAAYRAGLGLHDHKCSNVFIDPDDRVYIHEWSEEDLAKGLSIFLAANILWKLVKNY